MNRHRDPTFATSFPEVGKWPIHVQVSHYATIACRRLDRIGSGGKKQAKKPTDDEINQARVRNCRSNHPENDLKIYFPSPIEFRIKFSIKACSAIR